MYYAIFCLYYIHGNADVCIVMKYDMWVNMLYLVLKCLYVYVMIQCD